MKGEPAAPSLRERKKAEVRGALVSAALRLSRERGLDAVTVDEIAAAASVSRRSFFRYFGAKEDVVLARRREQLARFEAALEARRPADTPFAAVRRACLLLADEYASLRPQILAERALLSASPSVALRDLELDRAFEAAIERALGGGRSARICAAAVVAVVRVVLEDWAEAKGRVDLRALGEEALELLAPLAPQARSHARSR